VHDAGPLCGGDGDRPLKWPAAERAILDIRRDSGARPERPRYTAARPVQYAGRRSAGDCRSVWREVFR
jgi:hypothetical protein